MSTEGEQHGNKTEPYFPMLSDIDYKKILAISIYLERTYRNPNMQREDIISETYTLIKEEKRKFTGKSDYFSFIKNTMRSVARNSFDKMVNKSYSLDDKGENFIPSDYDTPEERFIKESEIKEVLESLASHPDLIEIAKTMFVEGLTGEREISEKLGISFDRAKYLKKKMIKMAKKNISIINKN